MWALTKCERVGALVVDALELDGHTYLMHRYQGSMVGGAPYVLEKWIGYTVVVTISSSSLRCF